ncbi:acyl carrier protein [Saccharopolyspora sp. NPDC047091]|uniref:acyl carrier protein n=1 Tax=Saccharopolyspora sp. NPDC047091 TaxID=3155924 RepID=UPI0033C60F2E
MNEIEERLCGIAGSSLGVEAQRLRDGQTFEDLGLDSLALIEFGIEVQREWGVRLEDDEIKPEFTLGDLLDLMAAKGVSA